MKSRKRSIQLHFMVNEQENEQIRQKMALHGISNMGAFLRKMSIDGYVINLDLPEMKEMISLLRRCSNNLNQYAKRAHETGSIYAADIEDLSQQLSGLWGVARNILTALGKL